VQIRLKKGIKASKGGYLFKNIYKVLEVQQKKKRYLISVDANVMWFIDFRDAEAV